MPRLRAVVIPAGYIVKKTVSTATICLRKYVCFVVCVFYTFSRFVSTTRLQARLKCIRGHCNNRDGRRFWIANDGGEELLCS